jgi:hypothetical protein
MADVNVLCDWDIQERCVDVKLTEIEVHGGRNGHNTENGPFSDILTYAHAAPH